MDNNFYYIFKNKKSMKNLPIIGKYLQKHQQLILYIIVGGFNTILSLFIYYFLLIINCNYLIASTLAYIFGIVLGFLMNAKTVFNSQNIHYKKFLKYVILYVISYVVNIFILYLLVNLCSLNKLFAQVISTLFLVFINFNVIKHFIFTESF